jgi:predicted Holliday junction resolvase-like endonuclease
MNTNIEPESYSKRVERINRETADLQERQKLAQSITATQQLVETEKAAKESKHSQGEVYENQKAADEMRDSAINDAEADRQTKTGEPPAPPEFVRNPSDARVLSPKDVVKTSVLGWTWGQATGADFVKR